MNKLWTDEEVRILKERLEAGDSYTEIGKKLGRSRSSIQHKTQRMGMKGNTGEWTPKETKLLRTHYPEQGANIPELLKTRTRTAIHTKASKLGISTQVSGGKSLIDETDNEYGELTVIKQVPTPDESSHTGAHWLCECSCGNEIIVLGCYLRAGDKTHCGCKGNKGRKHTRLEIFYRRYKRNAKKRGIQFVLSCSEFEKLTQQLCCYCGNPPEYEYTCGFVGNGIDREDNAKGYTKDNSVPCCPTCNRAKNHLTQEEFIEWGKRLGKHLEGTFGATHHLQKGKT